MIYDYKGVFLKNRRLKAIKKIVLEMSFYFLTEFLKYFFRVLDEASSSWLKFAHAFQNHPVYHLNSYYPTFMLLNAF
jgi:hypothetical protein